MTVHHDHRGYRPAPGPSVSDRLSPFWRWLSEVMWRLEHGFERAKADARPEEDTRVRIFLVLIVFSVVFGALALGATHAALFADKGRLWAAANPHALVRGDLTGLVRARRLSRAVTRNIRQNLLFAFGYNALGVPIAAGVLYPVFGILLSPMIAALAMSLSSVSVIGNALRLRSVDL